MVLSKGTERKRALCNSIYLKASFQPGWAPHIIIVARPPTVPAGIWTQDFSVQKVVLVIELMRQVKTFIKVVFRFLCS